MIRDAATERQVQAADPGASTWLSANAGSGKTRVLTDRVARLLLDGVEPQHILCLTYTKAAASEMQNRLFKRLGEWAMLEDGALRRALNRLGVEARIKPGDLGRARTLFARAIETPGGLKIQTIHSFCAALLRRFPLEAGVSPQFSEMEDRAAELLRGDIVDLLADGPHADVVRAMADHLSDAFDGLTAEIVKHREAFANPLDRAQVLALFDLDPTTTPESIADTVFLGGEAELMARLLPVLANSSTNDVKAARALEAVGRLDFAAVPALEAVFLTKSGKAPFTAKIGSFPTKAARDALADVMDDLDAFMLRIEAARDTRLAFAAAEKTIALHGFAAAFLPAYAAAKQARGWLDFDDLIQKARALLSDPGVAGWVLYRLDGGIDHILIDEAQDTSPAQWDVIEKLAQEFTSGTGAREETRRTIFVVGDKKQSIYSFQGADPGEFDRMKAEFAARLERSESPLVTSELEYSFRSSEAILRLVDHVFDEQPAAGFAPDAKHRTFKTAMPGRVDLWPAIPEAVKPDRDDFEDPVDRLPDAHHSVQLARRIAAEIARMTDPETGETLPVEIGDSGEYERRRVRAGDILILVQRRSALFGEIIRACKQAGLPIAGSDRLKVGAELAVRDLTALLSFLATQEDSLSLAVALKSPLFGWGENDLFRLAHPRISPHLWPALRDARDSHPQTLAVLRDLLGQVDFLRPYDLVERILTRHDGRRHLLARLGPEAEDGINALLSQALAYESSAVPSLTGFLTWLETDDVEIKRQMDNSGNQIRVMTVHGAKGLEAPIVILPDTAQRAIKVDDKIVTIGGDAAMMTKVDEMPPVLSERRGAMVEAQRRERMRLLYVAMTRAEKWLIVAAAGELGKSGESWYETIARSMEAAGAEAAEFAYGEAGMRFALGDWTGLNPREDTAPAVEPVTLPEYFGEIATTPDAAPETLSPSDLGVAKALAGEEGQDEEAALAHGSQVHLLLEHLPGVAPDNRQAAAERILRQAGHPVTDAAIGEALRVLDSPQLAPLFAEGTLAEVPVSATLQELARRRIHGVIDRLIVTPAKVIAVDFKTNRLVPATPEQIPEGLLRQMGAYRAALRQVFATHEIQTAILWTHTATLMAIPDDLVTEALSHAPGA